MSIYIYICIMLAAQPVDVPPGSHGHSLSVEHVERVPLGAKQERMQCMMRGLHVKYVVCTWLHCTDIRNVLSARNVGKVWNVCNLGLSYVSRM